MHPAMQTPPITLHLLLLNMHHMMQQMQTDSASINAHLADIN
jgi:hypothetical protein